MNVSQLQSLAALADSASFTEAAEQLSLTQSAVSHALASLERELGVTLLERNRRGVVALTGAGQTILPHVRAVLAQLEAIEQAALAARGETRGRLRVGSITSMVAPRLLAGVLTSFQQRYPAIEIVLFEGGLHEVGEWIERSVVDVGFVILPARGTETTLLATDELCVLMPRGHRLQSRSAVSPEELRGEGFIMEKTHCALQFMQRAGLRSSLEKPAIRFQASDSATIYAMVREGLGIALAPRSTLPARLDGTVALPFEPAQQVHIGLAVKDGEPAPPAARLFVEAAVDWTRSDRRRPSRAIGGVPAD